MDASDERRYRRDLKAAEQLRQQSQGLIDSTNKQFDDQVAAEKLAGQQRLNENNSVSVLSGLTAAWLHGVDVPVSALVEVTVPPEWDMSARTGLLIRRAHLAGYEEAVRHQRQQLRGRRGVRRQRACQSGHGRR